jgi:hypothetical protein
MEIKLKPKEQYRDPVLESNVTKIWRLITQPRSAVEDAIKDYDRIIKHFGEDALNEFNLPKEELQKTISAYRALVDSTSDLC